MTELGGFQRHLVVHRGATEAAVAGVKCRMLDMATATTHSYPALSQALLPPLLPSIPDQILSKGSEEVPDALSGPF